MGSLYMGSLYIGIALGAASLAVLVRRLLKNQSAKPLIDAWVGMFVGACFFITYALADGHSPFLLAIGLTCVVASVVVLLIVSRRTKGPGGQL